MEHKIAHTFVDAWLTAWNAHDLDALLAHFTDDVTFHSPVAAQLLGGDGVIRGKDALRAYWEEGLRRIPDLRFEVVAAYVGVSCLVINYRNQKGGLVNEVLIFDGPLVAEGHGTYLGDDSNPAGARQKPSAARPEVGEQRPAAGAQHVRQLRLAAQLAEADLDEFVVATDRMTPAAVARRVTELFGLPAAPTGPQPGRAVREDGS